MAFKTNLQMPTTEITIITNNCGSGVDGSGGSGSAADKDELTNSEKKCTHNETPSAMMLMIKKVRRKSRSSNDSDKADGRKHKKDKKKMARDSRKNLKKQQIPITISNDNSISDAMETEKLQVMNVEGSGESIAEQCEESVIEISEEIQMKCRESSPVKNNNGSTTTVTASAVVRTMSYYKKASVSQFVEEKQRISLSKERRAARTLGIIMGKKISLFICLAIGVRTASPIGDEGLRYSESG